VNKCGNLTVLLNSGRNPEECPSLPQGKLARDDDSSNAAG
jgi:hypothetical protein